MRDMNKILCVAIVGAGPAGYYTAEALTKGRDDIRVDIIDALPTPYGLIRAGVAPDHQSIKKVSQRYEATNTQDNVRFIGNLCLGRDISLDELRALYDVVVLATGAAKDRTLGIEGENLAGVIGSAAFVGWYNSHPDYSHLDINLQVPGVAVIGNGNVAIDVARVLAKTPHEMAASDLAGYAADHIHSSSIRDIYILGRRGPLESAFTPKELAELNRLEKCVALVDSSQLPTDDELPNDINSVQRKNLAILRTMTKNTPDMKDIRLHFLFYTRPTAITGGTGVEAIRVEHTRVVEGRAVGTGKFETLKVGLIVPCIGYMTSPVKGVSYDTQSGCFANDDGFIDKGLYCVGWAKRGPKGTIGTNKADAVALSKRILNEVRAAGKEGRAGLDYLARKRKLELITFAQWKKIEAAEIEAATDDAPRVKFSEINDMLHTAHTASQQ